MDIVPSRDPARGKIVILTPGGANSPLTMQRFYSTANQYEEHLAAMQRMRGSLYLAEGALQPHQISADGRHRLAVDERSWHVLALGANDEVVGCARYMAHDNTISFSKLGVCESALAMSAEWGSRLRRAVESEIALARGLGIAYVEVGGWAISPKFQNTLEALRIALSAYSLARILGGCVGIGTVTQRHLSSSILRRIGGKSLISQGMELPPYFDPNYGCQMEILSFLSSEPNPRYEVWIHDLQAYLLNTDVVPADVFGPSLKNLQASVGQNHIPTILAAETELSDLGDMHRPNTVIHSR